MKKIVLEMKGLTCETCAGKIEEAIRQLPNVEYAQYNLLESHMAISYDNYDKDVLIDKVQEIADRIEPGVIVSEFVKETVKVENEPTFKDFLTSKEFIVMFVGILLFIIPHALNLSETTQVVFYFLSYIILGIDVIISAFKKLMNKDPMDEHFLMTVATAGAFIIGEYNEAIMVMFLYKVGEFLQDLAVEKSRKDIKGLMNIRPETANLKMGETYREVAPEEVNVGDIIIVRPGERVPLDGVIQKGVTSLDTSSITGESFPVYVEEGSFIHSGSINNEKLIEMEVTTNFAESTVSKVLKLLEEATDRKAKAENFVTKFSKVYTPIVVFIAVLLAVGVPLIADISFKVMFHRALLFLVVSCPCAIVISVPLSFFSGIGAAGNQGILIKGANYLEALSMLDTIVFDKTGTITQGKFEVETIETYSDYNKDEILKIAAYAECYSTHPIAQSILEKYEQPINKSILGTHENIAGKGIISTIDGENYIVGNKQLLLDHQIKPHDVSVVGTAVYIADNKSHLGTIIVNDTLKDNIQEDIEAIKAEGVQKLVMLSGDKQPLVDRIVKKLGFSWGKGELLPQDKVSYFENIMKDKTGNVAFVGDGINDAPVIRRADIGISMGTMGSDAAIEASDIVIMKDELGKIATALKISKKTMRIVKQNIIFALAVKLIVMILGTFGRATMIMAVFSDVGVSIIAILNSIRALRVSE